MKRVKFFLTVALLAITVFMASPSRGALQEITTTQDPPPAVLDAQETTQPDVAVAQEDPAGPLTTMGGAFTYQGRLMNNGRAYTGSCSMTFSIYSGATSLDPVGVLVKTVQVNNGLFNTDLDFDVFPNPKPFTGEARYLGVRVKCGTIDQTLSPRQLITAVPYALGLKPDTEIAQGNGRAQLMSCPSNSCTALNVDTSTIGIRVRSATSEGVYIDQAYNGVKVEKATAYGVYIGQTNFGVRVANASGSGVYIDQAATGFSVVKASGNGVYIGQAVNGVKVAGTSGNAFNADVTTTYATIYGKNNGTGVGIASHSKSGAAVHAVSYTGDLFQGWEELTLGGSQTLRFKVTRTGYVYADGTYSSPAADFAELLPAVSGLEAGDVLVVSQDGNLTRSTIPNALNVVGVFATKPAFLGGFPNEQETLQSAQASQSDGNSTVVQNSTAEAVAEPVAKESMVDPLVKLYQENSLAPLSIVGIVPVKVSGENGAIMPGDLLTTSSLPGHAMKASQVEVGGISLFRPGTIIGKALESFDGETGVISVLISLQ